MPTSYESFVIKQLAFLEKELTKQVDNPLKAINRDIVKKVSEVFSKYDRYPSTAKYILIEKELRRLGVYRQISRNYGTYGKSFVRYLKGSLDDNFRETVKYTKLTLKASRKQAEEFETHYQTIANIESDWRQSTLKHSDDVKRILSKGIAKHQSIDDITNQLVKRTGMEIYKARRLADTETMNVINQASLQVYRDNGVGYVKWSNAVEQGRLGSSVCPYCLAYSHGGENKDGVYPIGKLPSKIPAHPHCRCILEPKTKK